MKKTIIFIIILSFSALLLLFVAFYSNPKKNNDVVFPSPSSVKPIPSSKTTPKGSAIPNTFLKGDSVKANYPQIPLAIGKLINRLPHTGVLFSLSYDYEKDGFSLILDKNDTSGAQKEYEGYLKNMGVLDKNWLQNVTLSYK